MRQLLNQRLLKNSAFNKRDDENTLIRNMNTYVLYPYYEDNTLVILITRESNNISCSQLRSWDLLSRAAFGENVNNFMGDGVVQTQDKRNI